MSNLSVLTIFEKLANGARLEAGLHKTLTGHETKTQLELMLVWYSPDEFGHLMVDHAELLSLEETQNVISELYDFFIEKSENIKCEKKQELSNELDLEI